MKVTYLGTTVLLFDDGIDQILFDCHLTRPSIPALLFGKLQTDVAVADRVIQEFDISRLKAVFVSHTHHDHVLDMPYVAKQCGADVYGSSSALNVARGGGIEENRLHAYGLEGNSDAFRIGQASLRTTVFQVGAYRITVIPSLHSKPNFFNNDLGQLIEEPLIQPAPKKCFKEGGSYDFLVEHGGKRYLIRPSYNYIPGQLDAVCESPVDVLFLGIAGIEKDTEENKAVFWKETVEKAQPGLIIPLHWDNFFAPLYGTKLCQPKLFANTEKALQELAAYCSERKIDCLAQLPLTTVTVTVTV